MKTKKQKEKELFEILEILDWIEFQTAHAIKLRVSQCDESELPGDDLCNSLFNISRQTSVVDYKLTKLIGD